MVGRFSEIYEHSDRREALSERSEFAERLSIGGGVNLRKLTYLKRNRPAVIVSFDFCIRYRYNRPYIYGDRRDL